MHYLTIRLSSVVLGALMMSSLPATHATPANGPVDICKAAMGEWRWFVGGSVNFSSNGTGRWQPAVQNVAPASCRWTCDTSQGTLTVTWQNGFVDTLRLSENGRKLRGRSSTGAEVTGWRSAEVAARYMPPPEVTTVTNEKPKGQWIQRTDMPPQKGPKPFPGWDKLIEQNERKEGSGE